MATKKKTVITETEETQIDGGTLFTPPEECSKKSDCLHVGEDCTQKGFEERGEECFESNQPPVPDEVIEKCAEEKSHAYDLTKEPFNCRVYPKETDPRKCANYKKIIGQTVIYTGKQPDNPNDEPEGEPVATVNVTAEGFTGKVSDTFDANLIVPVTPIELGEYSLEQATLYQEMMELIEEKKVSDKTYKERIERKKLRLDEIAKIVIEGGYEKPIPCQWQYDYEHGSITLVRLDTKEVVKTTTLTPEEYQQDLNFQEKQSIENVKEAFPENQAPEEEQTPQTNEQGVGQELETGSSEGDDKGEGENLQAEEEFGASADEEATPFDGDPVFED